HPKTLTVGPQEETRHDRQRQRKTKREHAASTCRRINLNNAADLFEVGTDNVHANTATRKICHVRRGRESGEQDQSIELSIAHAVQLVAALQTLLDRFSFYGLHIDATTVVANLDNHLPALLSGRELDATGRGLSRSGAFFRRLDSMIAAVAYQ